MKKLISSSIMISLIAMSVLCFACEDQKPAADKLPRDDFRKAVMGQSPQTVINLLGKPMNSTEYSNGDFYWAYSNRTYDPVTGNVDLFAMVYFRGNPKKVNEVHF